MKKGIYETEYGNAAFVNDDVAYDLDAGEVIPFDMVTDKFIREAEESDVPSLIYFHHLNDEEYF